MNANATLCGRYNYEKKSKWIKKAPGNNIFNLKNIYFIINIDNNHWVCIVVYMEEKLIQYYDSLKIFGKDDNYLKGTLRYLNDSDKKIEQIKLDEWKLVCCAETVPQRKNRFNCGAFVCMYCNYISQNSFLDFDESITAKFRKTIVLSILNGKGAGDRSDVTQSSQIHPIAAGTSESIAIRDVHKGSPQVF
jgi:Ulp1 family protease